MNIRHNKMTRIAVLLASGAIAAVGSFVLAGSVVASSPDQSAEHSSARPTKNGNEVALPVEAWATKNFPKNAKGMTYGSSRAANSRSEMPDLIAVAGDHGVAGFVLADDLLRVDGSQISSPEEAAKWQKQLLLTGPPAIPVWDQDLRKKVDTFTLAMGGTEVAEAN